MRSSLPLSIVWTALALVAAACGGGEFPDGRIVDLSHAYAADTIY